MIFVEYCVSRISITVSIKKTCQDLWLTQYNLSVSIMWGLYQFKMYEICKGKLFYKSACPSLNDWLSNFLYLFLSSSFFCFIRFSANLSLSLLLFLYIFITPVFLFIFLSLFWQYTLLLWTVCLCYNIIFYTGKFLTNGYLSISSEAWSSRTAGSFATFISSTSRTS